MSDRRLLNSQKSLRHIRLGLRVIAGAGAVLLVIVGLSFHTLFYRLGENTEIQTWLDRGASSFSGEVMHCMVSLSDSAAAFTLYDDPDLIAEKIDYAQSTVGLIFTPKSAVGDALALQESNAKAKADALHYLRVAREALAERPLSVHTRTRLRQASEASSESMQQLRIEVVRTESQLRDTMVSAVDGGRRIGFLAIPAVLFALLVLGITVFILYATAKKWAKAEEERHQHFSLLAASIGRDIRIPLQSVLAAANIMASKYLSKKELERYTLIITESASRLKQLVDDLFALSRRGSLQVAKKPIVLASWIKQAVVSHWIAAEQKSLAFELVSNLGDDIVVEFDESRLTQLLANLIENAIKFTSQGYVRVTVSWRMNADERSGVLYVTVEDSGIGISKADRERIWDPLALTGGLMQANEGTGLGLAIVYEIARSVGGQVTLHSTPGRGSRFDVVMPLPLVRDAGALCREALLKSGAQKDRVLIVDSDAAVRRVLRQVLEDMGYEALGASDGLNALQILQKTPCGIVMIDLRIEGMEAFKLAGMIREHADRPSRLVALTTYSGDEAALRDAGLFDAILFKPVDAAALQRTLASLCEGASAG